MNSNQINELVTHGEFPEPSAKRELVETHISWVIIGDTYVYKIKKPMHYSFLDFSTLEKRKFYCEGEIQLNQRLAPDVYLKVVSIKEEDGSFAIDEKDGNTIDYAVKMKKLDRSRQMDVLLGSSHVSSSDIQAIVNAISAFHKQTKIITEKNCLDVQIKFNELNDEAVFLGKQCGLFFSDLINKSVEQSNQFIESHRQLLFSRLKSGFFRDCHGDLHSRNIFLLPRPVIFDCIEFNDDYRQIDVLNEIAFLGMDLDAFGRHDLSAYLIDQYNRLFPVMKSEEERRLFLYYKSYRANVRAKVNSLRARDAQTVSQRENALCESKNYLKLMSDYLKKIEQVSIV